MNGDFRANVGRRIGVELVNLQRLAKRGRDEQPTASCKNKEKPRTMAY
jgi:hypothetical protein